jgi:hypothetical protein
VKTEQEVKEAQERFVNDNYERLFQKARQQFVDNVRREYEFAIDKEFQEQEKKRAHEAHLAKMKQEYITEFKKSIMASAKEGQKECWFRIYREFTAEELTEYIGFSIRADHKRTSYGDYRNNEDENEFYVATIAE